MGAGTRHERSDGLFDAQGLAEAEGTEPRGNQLKVAGLHADALGWLEILVCPDGLRRADRSG